MKVTDALIAGATILAVFNLSSGKAILEAVGLLKKPAVTHAQKVPVSQYSFPARMRR